MGGMAYMCKNRHGTYYARFIIPKHLQSHFENKKEIRRSLQTDSRKLAVKRARVYRVQFESIVEQLMVKEFSAFEVTLEGATVATLPNGEKKTITGKITRSLASPDEDTTQHKQYLLNQLREEARREEETAERQQREQRAEEVHQAQLAAITTGTLAGNAALPIGKKTTEYLDDYIAHKLTPGKKGSWSEGTARQKPNKLNVFRSVFGDKPAAELTRDDMNNYIDIAYKIPSNFENPIYKKFKGITLDMVLTNAPEIEAIDYGVRGAGTVRDDLKTIRAFLNWVLKRKDETSLQTAINALDNEISDIDYESSRRAFTDEELKTLLQDDNTASENYVKGFSNPINFWLPLIALYTGARIAEICQLHLTDIKQVKALSSHVEHWCIDINDDGDKKLKTKNSKRQIPIHQNLINAGLITYADDLKAKRETKLFPDAARASDQFGGQSQWFGIYSGKAGITDKDIAFHSFRHCFTNYLNNRHTPEDLVIALSGHQYKSIAKSTYDRNRKRDVGKLAEVIDSIDYGLIHPEFK
ncbi:phage integrase family protein [Methylobacter tundripaludum]|uniref:Phage integrase family protein n=1 Tax=Methylobacter tundripaludum TaxID=173365 RepID=A0A2S6HDX0_9GAMM|nr:site-specific integrase [Methylobacter tundripaludum]PPK75593.1 phage integrase family protein [Methylobacter tundripaludum]